MRDLLKVANLGISMGKLGTDIVRDFAEIVIEDDTQIRISNSSWREHLLKQNKINTLSCVNKSKRNIYSVFSTEVAFLF